MITLTLGENHFYSGYCDRIGYISQELKRPGKGGRTSKIKCIYIGCGSFSEAQKVAKYFGFNSYRCLIRESERAIDWEWEVKVQGDWLISQIDAISQKVTLLLDDNRGSGRDVVKLVSERATVDGDRKLVNQSEGFRRYFSKKDWRKQALIR